MRKFANYITCLQFFLLVFMITQRMHAATCTVLVMVVHIGKDFLPQNILLHMVYNVHKTHLHEFTIPYLLE